MYKNEGEAGVWLCWSVIPALRRLRQEGEKFETSLGLHSETLGD
jgi:hypothetical protein